MTVDLSTFRLPALLNDIEKIFREKAVAKKMDILVEQSPGLPGFIETDEMKLRQIIYILMDNAVKFTGEGRVELRVRASGIEAGGITLCIDVEDTGPGIAEDDMENLFRPFSQTEKGAKTGGTGIGLALCREFARMLGGDVTVKSEAGKGSLFTASIRVREGEESSIKDRGPAKKPGQDAIRAPVTADSLKGLPDDLVDGMMSAIVRLDRERLLELTGRAAEINAEAGEHLRVLAKGYQYDALISLFEERRKSHERKSFKK